MCQRWCFLGVTDRNLSDAVEMSTLTHDQTQPRGLWKSATNWHVQPHSSVPRIWSASTLTVLLVPWRLRYVELTKSRAGCSICGMLVSGWKILKSIVMENLLFQEECSLLLCVPKGSARVLWSSDITQPAVAPSCPSNSTDTILRYKHALPEH